MTSSRRNGGKNGITKRSTTQPSRPAATPVMDKPRADVPAEFIDLSTEPFRTAFPDLAERESERIRRARRHQRPPSGDGEDNDR